MLSVIHQEQRAVCIGLGDYLDHFANHLVQLTTLRRAADGVLQQRFQVIAIDAPLYEGAGCRSWGVAFNVVIKAVVFTGEGVHSAGGHVEHMGAGAGAVGNPAGHAARAADQQNFQGGDRRVTQQVYGQRRAAEACADNRDGLGIHSSSSFNAAHFSFDKVVLLLLLNKSR